MLHTQFRGRLPLHFAAGFAIQMRHRFPSGPQHPGSVTSGLVPMNCLYLLTLPGKQLYEMWYQATWSIHSYNCLYLSYRFAVVVDTT